MTYTIYHNPNCGTSRNTLAMLEAAGVAPDIIAYLETPPTRARLVELIGEMGITPRALLRQKGTPYDALGLDRKTLSDDEIIDHMMAHPILIDRPIVVSPKGTKLCRPSETVVSLLPDGALDGFTKEDGTIVLG